MSLSKDCHPFFLGPGEEFDSCGSCELPGWTKLKMSKGFLVSCVPGCLYCVRHDTAPTSCRVEQVRRRREKESVDRCLSDFHGTASSQNGQTPSVFLLFFGFHSGALLLPSRMLNTSAVWDRPINERGTSRRPRGRQNGMEHCPIKITSQRRK